VLPVVLAEIEHDPIAGGGVGDKDLAQPGVGVPDLCGVAPVAQCGEGGRLGAVEEILVELGDVEVQVKGEPVSVAVGVQGLPAAEGEPKIGDRLQRDLGDETLERGERHRAGSPAQLLARAGCWASQNSRTARGRVRERHSRRSRSALR